MVKTVSEIKTFEFELLLIFTSRELGLIDRDCDARFVYYVSDVPLEHGESLSAAMSLHEGIPPLYAITREILVAVMSDDSGAERDALS